MPNVNCKCIELRKQFGLTKLVTLLDYANSNHFFNAIFLVKTKISMWLWLNSSWFSRSCQYSKNKTFWNSKKSSENSKNNREYPYQGNSWKMAKIVKAWLLKLASTFRYKRNSTCLGKKIFTLLTYFNCGLL